LELIVRLNPLTYGVAGLRHYLQNGPQAGALPNIWLCWLISLAFAAAMLWASWRMAGTRSTADLQ
jgi:ABC-type polysaccharide/polyol phosphate export permease